MNFDAGYAGPSPCPDTTLTSPAVIPDLAMLDLTGNYYLISLDRSGDLISCGWLTTDCYRLPLGSTAW